VLCNYEKTLTEEQQQELEKVKGLDIVEIAKKEMCGEVDLFYLPDVIQDRVIEFKDTSLFYQIKREYQNKKLKQLGIKI
jgi:hypothetical protein